MTRETHISIYFNKTIIKGIFNDENTAQRLGKDIFVDAKRLTTYNITKVVFVLCYVDTASNIKATLKQNNSARLSQNKITKAKAQKERSYKKDVISVQTPRKQEQYLIILKVAIKKKSLIIRYLLLLLYNYNHNY